MITIIMIYSTSYSLSLSPALCYVESLYICMLCRVTVHLYVLVYSCPCHKMPVIYTCVTVHAPTPDILCISTHPRRNTFVCESHIDITLKQYVNILIVVVCDAMENDVW